MRSKEEFFESELFFCSGIDDPWLNEWVSSTLACYGANSFTPNRLQARSIVVSTLDQLVSIDVHADIWFKRSSMLRGSHTL